MKFDKNKIFNIIIITCFFVVSFIVIQFHEPWADEAHAWLFARDASVIQLLTKYAHSDGHPILWHLILKFFIFLGLPYKKIGYISLLFSTIGVSLFVCKSKFNKVIKLLFSFSYFVLYQYTVIARGYCLILPILCLIAMMWNERHKKIYLISFLLILLLNCEAYTYLISGSIFLILIIEFYKNKYDNKCEHYISFIVLFFSFLLTALYVYPYKSNTFIVGKKFYSIAYSFFLPYFNMLNLSVIYIYFGFILGIIVFLLFFKIYSKNKNNLLQFVLLIMPVFMFFSIKYFAGWHLGIMMLLVVFCFWIHDLCDEKLVKIFLILSFVSQIPWTFYTCYKDIYDRYSGSYEAAKFIKEYDFNNLKIMGVGFHSSALNPYFEKNIFYNWPQDISFYYWDYSNPYYDIFKEAAEEKFPFFNSRSISEKSMIVESIFIPLDYIFEENPDIVVVGNSYFDKSDDKILLAKYDLYEFEGNLYFELDKYENRTFYLYVRKGLNKV